MKNETKVRLKVVSLCLIIVFVLISSSAPNITAVNPEYEAYGSTADTIYDTTSSADAYCPSDFMENWTKAGEVVFKVDYTFENNHASDGSYHIVLFWVTRTIPSPANFQTDTGWVFVAPEDDDHGSLTLSDFVTVTGYSYDIVVECRVKKNIGDQTYTSDTDNYKWSV